MYVKVLCLSLAMFGADMTLPPSWAFCIDIGRANAGAVSGTMNMAGNIGSFVTSLAFPYLLAVDRIAGAVLPRRRHIEHHRRVALWTRARPDRPLVPVGDARRPIMKVRLFGALVLILAGIAVPDAWWQTSASAAVSGELRQWHKVTLTFDGPNASETRFHAESVH